MTEAALTDRLRLMQLLSPAFPIGSFAYSQGLEAAIDAGDIRDAAGLTDWIAAVLTHGSGRMDAILLILTRNGASPDDLSALSLAYAGSAERAQELREQGRAFALMAAAVTGQDMPIHVYPVAVGVALRGLAIADEDILALWLQSVATQMISAAVRFVPLGQAAGQKVLAALAPVIERVAMDAARASLTDMSSTTLGADLAMMRHETMDVRIFRT